MKKMKLYKKIILLFSVFLLCMGCFDSKCYVEAENAKVQAIINFAYSKLHSAEYSGYCQAFVKDCYQAAGIYASSNAPSASAARDMWCVSRDLNNIPVGACVYWKDEYNGDNGHVAIYLGNGRIIHTVKGVYDNSNVSYVCEMNLSYYTQRDRIYGWGYQAGYDLYSGESVAPAYTITNQDYENLTETSVTIKAMLDKTTTNMSECGVYIGTSTENMTQIRESVNVGTQVRYMSYGTQKWYGTLTPGTTYYYRFYAIIGGTTYWGDYGNFTTAGSPPDSQAPTISNVKFERIAADTVIISCTVTDNSQVTKVAFPVWTDANGQDDLQPSWNTECIGTQNGTTWSYIVKDADHNYEKGKYIVHIYAWDSSDNHSVSKHEFNFDNLFKVIASVENGSRYELYDDILTWEQAKAKCEELGGHLVTITSEKEQKVIQSLVSNGCRYAYFMGGCRENGSLKWITGEKFSYTNWASGQPDNWQDRENVFEFIFDGTWNDIPNNETNRGFICEYDKEKSPVRRISGQSRYETSYKVADALLEELGLSQFNAVIVASGKTFPDALAGSSLAAQKNAPKLREYIKKNLKQNGTIYVLGGKAAVSEEVFSDLSGNYQIKRLSGNDRYATNLAILGQLSMSSGDILVCTGKNFADSLSASATGKPILLVGKNLTEQQRQFLSNNRGKRFYIIGGESAVSKSIESQIKTYGSCIRISGQTRFETSIAVAEAFFGQPKSAVVAYAKNFPDGLSGSSLAYAMKAPLILTMTGKEDAAVTYTAVRNIKECVVLGGTKLISDNCAKKIFNVNKIGY